MTDDWGDDLPEAATATEVPSSAELALAEGPELSVPIRCPNCGEWHAICRDRAVELRWSYIRAKARDRLDRTEAAIGLMTEIERVATARWLQGVLDRPPLANSRAFDYLRELLDGLWRDIYWMTPDPLSPTVDWHGETWTVPEPHHELVEMREGEFVRP